jgi:ATP-dependent DNA helicase RecG
MGKDEADRMVVDRAQSTRRWETGTSPLNMRDLDLAEIRKTMQRAIDSGRLPSTSSSDPMDVLNGFHLRKGATLLHGAAALFAKQGSAHYPQFALRMARFRGVDKSEFLDQRQVNGNLFRLMDEAVEFLNRHLPVAGRVEPGLFERVDAPLFPPVALREALVNAFLHRDYSIVGGSVRVAVYDNRLEIWSDGSLPFGLTVGALLTNTQSRQRNPLIGEVLFRRGLVERWGRGIREIVRLCVQAGHPEPQFVEESGSFGVRFLPSAYVAPLRVGHDLTGRQREILQVLAACERASFGKIRERISTEVAERTLRDDLLHLKRLGMVESEGHGRGAKWWLVRVTGE